VSAEHQNWARVKEVFSAAAARSGADRAAFLNEACAGDPRLRAEVDSLLSSHDSAGGFLATSASDAAVWPEPTAPDPMEGRLIGSYQVLSGIGHGGMGAVYVGLRADDAYHKRVAIKVVKPGMNTEEILLRFRQERRTLARLDHPNIARLIDGGSTEEGCPYFVMDYVEGEPIDRYCRARDLSIEDRLRLFRAVCAAVHYAHQNLVVHRDLKPDNILVTADGSPKLLDFGIAKLLSPDAAEAVPVTKASGRTMTLRYASPEQVRGEPVTTASDVYALGVLAYELLTGRWPYALRTTSDFAMQLAICDAEPEQPSADRPINPEESSRLDVRDSDEARRTDPRRLETERRRLRGDLDAIVLMAIRKEPARRYGSAQQLSEDIRRYLDGVPVIARKDTVRYRARLFVRRHKAGVAAAALVVLTLIGGIAATTMQARVADRERARAERRFNEVRQLANALVFEIDEAIVTLPGSTSVRQLLVKRGLEHLDSLAAEAADDRSLRRELATAYSRIGVIQWNRYYSNLGDIAGAMDSQRKALDIREALVASGAVEPEIRRDLANSFVQLGDLCIGTGDVTSGLDAYRKAVALREALRADDPGNPAIRRDLFVAYQRMGDSSGNPAFPNIGDTPSAITYYEKMLTLMEGLANEEPTDPNAQHSLSIGFEKLGDMQRVANDREAALGFYQKALAVRDRLVTAHPTNARYLRDLSVSYGKVGDLLSSSGQTREALPQYHHCLRIRESLARVDPKDAQAQLDLAGIQGAIGQAHFSLKDYARAEANYDAALRILEQRSSADPSSGFVQSRLVANLERLVALKMQTGESAAARVYAMRVVDLKRTRARRADATVADLLDYARYLLTGAPESLRDPHEALMVAERAVAMSGDRDRETLATLALAYHLTGSHAQAVAAAEKALALASPESSQFRELTSDLIRFRAAANHRPN